MESFIKWTITENVSRCSKRILATKKVQIEFFRSLMAYVLIFLGFLDREVSNVTVHAVAQAAVQMKESDDQNASFVLEIDVAERCARKTCYNIPRWLLEGFVDYFVSVRSEFLDHGEGTPFERLLREVPIQGYQNSKAKFVSKKARKHYLYDIIFTGCIC